MKINLNINTDNAAFLDNELEAYDICANAIMRIFRDGVTDGNLRDSNGNAVGSFTVEGEK